MPTEYTLLAGQHYEDDKVYNVGDRIRNSRLDLSKDPEKYRPVMREPADFSGMSPTQLRELADKLEAEALEQTRADTTSPEDFEVQTVHAGERAANPTGTRNVGATSPPPLALGPGAVAPTGPTDGPVFQPTRAPERKPLDFDKMTPGQLRAFAADKEIDLTGTIERKDIIARIKERM